ncbi:MAG: thiamine diphosphokinase [Clostridia bacterium]|nr:thiamine diphosphokinase [Clostridia bacterium]
MKTCYIFCAGGFDRLAEPIGAGDYVLAADGGLMHTQALGLVPDGIIGDFDSLGYVPEGAQVFPVEKDDTDSMLAVRKGLELGCRRFVLYGAMDGPRLDHTLANLQTLCFLAEHGAVGYLVGLSHTATAVREETVRFAPEAAGILSVFCLGADAIVTLRGLRYELNRDVLQSSFPLGVSNHFIKKPAGITVHSGTVVALWDTANGLPAGR